LEKYPEINFSELKNVVATWARKYPSINQITFYPNKVESHSDQEKLYFLDICFDVSAPLDQIKAVELCCAHIDSSPFYRDLNRAKSDAGGFKVENWEIFHRLENDLIPVTHITNDCKEDGSLILYDPANLKKDLNPSF